MSHLSEATTRSPAPCTLSFEEFKKRKQINRSSVIAKNGKKKKANVEVKIQIGILHVVDGVVRKAKGRTLPVATNAAVNASEMLQIAIDKHTKHFQQFNTACEYVLLYPDHTIVNTLPGSLSQRFTLESYKEDLGKTYAKIYLWLCKQEDYEAFVDLESDPEGDNLPPAFSEKRCNDNANKIPSVTGHDKVASGNTSPSSSVFGPSNTIIPYLSFHPQLPLIVSHNKLLVHCVQYVAKVSLLKLLQGMLTCVLMLLIQLEKFLNRLKL